MGVGNRNNDANTPLRRYRMFVGVPRHPYASLAVKQSGKIRPLF